ncbi:ABC transporter permease [Paenibacillus apiarius]|uniref:ABC transporter permease n=1 Tax=Paenibacillus apiarius TaxID=46240 RepID=A0ABT4DSQ0_9BACL|nr:ABC transporter permease [Paenibacillus apiarius]MCY9515794.1 ABC transporter permease [Paenibacillus apiarius]MCY9520392.1 ABC transporter permease [Paenibacillus apiarius]MCY9555000.1 ABC transporter permease [Paenibacillus apiarius]MCY9559046.1 ABC transporter permease [Paenibacillus apiarius]MCY9685627.1 ABC transporter permease [Paenibacillus apiarius]
MTEYLIRRILQSILVLFLVSIVTFALIHAAPGGPTQVFLSPGLSQEAAQIQAKNLGLDQPVYIQYMRWMGNLLQGDLGHTFKNNLPVGEILWPTMQNTLVLMSVAWLFSLLIAIPWGIYNSTAEYGLSDQTASFISYLGFAMPTFWFGILLQELFALELDLLPLSDMYTMGREGEIGDLFMHLILPVTVLTLGFLASYVKYSRSSMLEVLNQDYIRTARAKGMKEKRVIYRHALRNAMIPIVTILGSDLAILVSGAAITENVFNWPGMGRLFVEMALAREYSVLMAITLITAVIVIIGNLIADILYALIDPRVQLARKGGASA